MTTKNNEKLTFKETLALLKTEAKENYQEFKVNIKNPIIQGRKNKYPLIISRPILVSPFLPAFFISLSILY